MDVMVWLRSLGLGKYEAAFRENDIDETVLPNLTAEDLKELGIGSLGHRRKLLDAIAALRSDAGAQAPSPAGGAAPSLDATTTDALVAEAVGERRHLTVMFCDLVGSTSISAALDAEDWRDLVGAYLDAASAAVTEMGGYVAKKLGDGLMAVFGYPVAQENDTERAARAALSIQRALADLNRKNAGAGKPALNARVGIETGPVVVDAVGEIYGDAPNTAARVQALAEPGTVWVTAGVRRQVAGLFVAEERGSHKLKGVPEPVTLFRLVRASGGGRRAGQRNLTPLVGRDEEMAMLMRRWERARQGDGQLTFIVGEPGIGKSRLIEEFHAGLREAPHTWVEWTCSQLLLNTPLHPIAEWGRQRFGGADIPADRRRADLENTLALIKLDPEENVPLLAPLLDIPLPPDRTPALAPAELRRRQLAALTNLVMTGARTQPAVLAVEDVHWADPTTLDVLRGIAERGALAPLFVLVAARPEFRPSWGARSHHGTISLVPLDRHQVRHMVEELAARHALTKEVIEGVTQRTGGVPLFVEEVTRLLLERGELGGSQAIPPTLQQSLTARLDRLGPAREVAQISAVIGRDFSYELLRVVAGLDDAPLQAALDRLAEADILLVQGLPPDADYRFKHALIQDAAYENLLKSRRQILHRRIAETLRERVAAGAGAEPELLAHHFAQAGLTEDAIEWWGKAGQRSLERSALLEAVAKFTRGLDQIATLPGTPALRSEQIKLQVGLANALYHTKGFSAVETQAAFNQARAMIEQAEALGEHVEDPLLLYSVLYGFFIAKFIPFEGETAHALASQFLELARQQKATAQVMIGHRILGTTLFCLGEPAEGLSHIDHALALYDPVAHRSLTTHFGHDIGAAALSLRSWALWLLGYPEAALAEIDHALKAARETAHTPTLMFALGMTTFPQICCRNYAGANAQIDECMARAEEKGTVLWKMEVTAHRGSVLALVGKSAEAIQTITSGIDGWRSSGATVFATFWLSHLALAYADLGKFDDAWRTLDQTMTAIETSKEKWCEAETNRIAGEIALKSLQPDGAKAEAYFERAFTISRQQQAKSWELRAAMSLARLWRSQGKVQQARELLAPVYGWFTEGFDTRDLKEAKALLEELTS